MKYDPKDVNNLVAEGVADYEVTSGEDCFAKKTGAEQIKLTVKLWDANGKSCLSNYYVTQPWQLKKICESANKMDVFEGGNILALDLVGMTGKCLVKTEVDPGGQYDDKSTIAKFVKHDNNVAKHPLSKKIADEQFDDDIPFN